MQSQPIHLVAKAPPPVPVDRLVRISEVEHLTSLKKSSIYALMRAGKFVRPVRLSARCTAWPLSSVSAWVQDRIATAGGAR